MDRNYILAVIVIAVLVGVAYGPDIATFVDDNFQFPWEKEPTTTVTVPPGTETSAFKFTPVKRDASGTAVTGATVRVWYDSSGDGKMQYNELKLVTESSGTYTSVKEYPIGESFHFWAQVQAANYFTSYIEMYMTGSRNTDGSAKVAEVAESSSIEVTYISDDETYAGLIGNVAWDDSADYNSTTYGTDEIVKILTTITTADQGLASQVWEQVNYETIYSSLSTKYDKDHAYWVKWDEINENGIPKFYAGTFLGVQMSLQDALDFTMKAGDWDGLAKDETNAFYWASESVNWAEFFHYSSDTTAPEGEYQFTCSIGAAGTTVATVGVGFWFNLEYDDMTAGTWGSSATYYAGTPGSDWDFTP